MIKTKFHCWLLISVGWRPTLQQVEQKAWLGYRLLGLTRLKVASHQESLIKLKWARQIYDAAFMGRSQVFLRDTDQSNLWNLLEMHRTRWTSPESRRSGPVKAPARFSEGTRDGWSIINGRPQQKERGHICTAGYRSRAFDASLSAAGFGKKNGSLVPSAVIERMLRSFSCEGCKKVSPGTLQWRPKIEKWGPCAESRSFGLAFKSSLKRTSWRFRRQKMWCISIFKAGHC